MAHQHDKLGAIFGQISEIEATYKVYSQATYYKYIVMVYLPHVPFDKLIPFMEPVKKIEKTKKDEPEKESDENIARSVRRSRKNIRELVLCNDFQLFVTFTFSPEKVKDRSDVDSIKKHMHTWLKNQKEYHGSFDYLLVPEFHKDGESLHFHALLAGYKGKLVDSGKRINGRRAYNIASYRLGYSTAVQVTDSQKAMNYLRKYITKDMPRFHGKKRYWRSTGLDRQLVVDNPDPWYKGSEPLWTSENEHGVLLYYPRLVGEGDEGQAPLNTPAGRVTLERPLITDAPRTQISIKGTGI